MNQSVIDDDTTVDAVVLHDAVVRALRANGASERGAEVQAGHLVEGELRGHASHGIRRLETIVGRLRAGLIDGDAHAELDWTRGAMLRVDGRLGFGPVVARQAIAELEARVGRTGIAIATLRNTNHLGMLAPYVESIARSGRIGIALTTSEALVHPWRGSRAMVGTNPIAIAVPTTGEPLVLDMSTAAVSMGRIIDHAERGMPIPGTWALDAGGFPTTDAAAALTGAISPFGGPKGYALGVALEAIVGVLASGAFGRDVRGTLDTASAPTKGDVLIVIESDSDAAPALTAYLDALREEPGVRVPGDRARASRAERLATGIPLDPAVWARVTELAQETR